MQRPTIHERHGKTPMPLVALVPRSGRQTFVDSLDGKTRLGLIDDLATGERHWRFLPYDTERQPLLDQADCAWSRAEAIDALIALHRAGLTEETA